MTASSGHILPRIADWAAAQRAFSSLARQRARDAVLDTLACMVAGTTDPVHAALLSAFAGSRGGGDALLAGGGCAPQGVAALLNGAAAHALDFDDNFRSGRSHASAVLVPALLAAAPEGTSGARFLDAYCIGLEAQAIIGQGLGNAHYIAGWHPTGTTGAIGSAAGVAALLGLDAAGVSAAMSSATSMAAGLKRQFGTAMKPIHAGLAARAAVEAALMARVGIAGDPAVLDGPEGLLALYGTANSPGWEGMLIGTPPAIEAEGLVPKLYPCCGSTHWVLDMLFAARRREGFSAGDVAQVVTRIGPANARNLPYAAPRTGMEARFSMQYCVALALLQPALTLEDFTDAAVMRPEPRALLALTRLEAHAEAEELANGGPLPHRLSIRFKDGRVMEEERQEVRGAIQEPFTAEETRAKFIGCLSLAGVPKATAGRLHDRAMALPSEPDLSSLHAVLTAPSA